MVKTGQPLPAEFQFRNPDNESFEIEEFDFTEFGSRLPDPAFSRPHRPNFHQLMFVTAGAGETMVDFVVHRCVPGTLIHVSPGQVQRLPYRPGGGPATLEARMMLFPAHFPPNLPDLWPIMGSPTDVVALNVPPGERERLTASWTEVAAEYRRAKDAEDTEPETSTLLALLLGALLIRIARMSDRADSSSSPRETFRMFQDALERSYVETRSVSDYAARLGYSPRTLNRICEAASGRNAKKLINARVALEARRLLAHSEVPVAGIAYQLGFGDPSNFAKFFAREVGVAPGAFRQAQRSTVH